MHHIVSNSFHEIAIEISTFLRLNSIVYETSFSVAWKTPILAQPVLEYKGVIRSHQLCPLDKDTAPYVRSLIYYPAYNHAPMKYPQQSKPTLLPYHLLNGKMEDMDVFERRVAGYSKYHYKGHRVIYQPASQYIMMITNRELCPLFSELNEFIAGLNHE